MEWELDIFSVNTDKVINSVFLTCKTTYDYTIRYIIPLMDRLDFQRKIQNQKFYKRLSSDINSGCIMPALTLAFIDQNAEKYFNKSKKFFHNYVSKNISTGLILDGIQRLNTLKKSSLNEEFDRFLPIFFNILICPSKDKLLYRMITLNNGQKPMTTRHQIEILLSNVYNFKNGTITILSEKEAIGGKAHGSFKASDFINAYLAFLSSSTNIDNKKIIEERLDELLANQIIERGISSDDMEFSDIIEYISKHSQEQSIKKWFQNENNLIGFCVAMRSSFSKIASLTTDVLLEMINYFEKMFITYTDVSKVRVSNFRRKLVHVFFTYFNINYYRETDPGQVFMNLSEKAE